MSHVLVAKALDELVLPPREKAVLVAMAEMARDGDQEFWISEARLSYRTGYNEKTVRVAIRALRRSGLVVRTRRGQRDTGEAARYLLPMNAWESFGSVPFFDHRLGGPSMTRAELTLTLAQAAERFKTLRTTGPQGASHMTDPPDDRSAGLRTTDPNLRTTGPQGPDERSGYPIRPIDHEEPAQSAPRHPPVERTGGLEPVSAVLDGLIGRAAAG